MTARGPAFPGADVFERPHPDAPARRLARAATVALLLAGVIGAVALRILLLRFPLTAPPEGLVFGGALLVLAAAAGSRIPSLSRRVLATGLAGGGVLVLVPLGLDLVNRGGFAGPVVGTNGGLYAPAWVVVTLVVACGEEAVLRGALFRVCLRPLGIVGTLLLTSAVFALIHLPFYGWGAIPLDFAVGVWLGGLRLASGSAAAAAIAHSVADLAAWWL
jgi:membrane protease YdiL (CAAX protease family)